VVVAIVVLATTACGVTDQAEGGTTTTPEETTSTVEEATTEVDSEDTAGRAEAALATAEDFPPGFQRTERAADGPGGGEGGGDLEASCTPELENPGETVAQASSSAFTSGDLDANDGTYFTADSAVFSSEEIAIGVVDRFGDDAYPACASESIKEPFAPARAIGDLEAVGGLPFGAQAAGLEGVLTITYPRRWQGAGVGHRDHRDPYRRSGDRALQRGRRYDPGPGSGRTR
jgi:hypothetical protein